MSKCTRLFLGVRGTALLLVLGLGACGTGGASLGTPAPAAGPAAGASPLLVLTDSLSDAQGHEHDQVEADLNGKQQWAVSLPAPGNALAAADGVVYVGAGDTLYALDVQTGQQRWSASASPQVRSIRVLAGLVYVDTGGGFAGPERLVVFSPDGRVRWQYIPPNDQDIGVWLVDSGVFYTITGGLPALLIARDAASGAERWEAPLQIESLPVALLPVGLDALLVVTQERVILQRKDGSQGWRRDQTQAIAAQVMDGTLYAFFVDQPASIGGLQQPVLRALQVSDGRPLWEQPLPANDAGFLTLQQPLAAGTLTPQGIYLTDGANFETVHAWNLPDGRTRWTQQLGEPLQGLRADANTVYLSSSAHLLALQAASGQVRWQQANPGNLTSLREEAGLLLGVNSLTNTLAAFDLTSGRIVWRVQPHALQQYLLISRGT